MERYKPHEFKEAKLELTTSEQKELKQQIKNWIDTFDNNKVEHRPGLSSFIVYYVKAFDLPEFARSRFLKLDYDKKENKKKLYDMLKELYNFL
jgi:hypothetical protein